MDTVTKRAIVLNLGDGLVTSLSFLLPMVLFGGHLDSKAMLIGATGGAFSMAFSLDDSEDGKGTRIEFIAALLSSAAGGILPTIPFIIFPEPYAGIIGTLVVLCGLGTLVYVKQLSMGVTTALKQVARSAVPAIGIVSALSLIH
jgi:VIT1/CCC1 family predicted Fe2+/Mn2+ transporter